MIKSRSRSERHSRNVLLLLALSGILSLAAASCGSDGESGSTVSPVPTPPAEPSPPPEPAPTPPVEPTPAPTAEPDDPLTVYSGRNEDLIGPLVEMFEEATGIEADVRYGSSADLALLIETEGDATPADVFISQSPGAMGYLATQDRLQALPASILDAVDALYRAGDGTWLGFSGRQRVLVYNPNLVDPADLPGSVLELTDPAYNGRVAVAPANSSFQDFITAMRFESGDDVTLAWLEGMAANNSPNYPKNSAIVDAVLRGEVDMGLVNHYYLLRFLAEDPDAPGINHNFASDDIGSLLIVTTGRSWRPPISPPRRNPSSSSCSHGRRRSSTHRRPASTRWQPASSHPANSLRWTSPASWTPSTSMFSAVASLAPRNSSTRAASCAERRGPGGGRRCQL